MWVTRSATDGRDAVVYVGQRGGYTYYSVVTRHTSSSLVVVFRPMLVTTRNVNDDDDDEDEDEEHQRGVGVDERRWMYEEEAVAPEDEDEDRALLGPPEPELEPEEGDAVQGLDQQDAEAEGDDEPDREQNRSELQVCAPVGVLVALR